MKNRILYLLVALLLASNAMATIRVVASSSDLASIAKLIGGNRIEVEAINKGTANPHSIEVLPSYMMKVTQAKLYLKIGLGLDFWAQPIIDGARNSQLKIIDCSQGVKALDVPSGKVDASMGDVHPEGNPHYWLQPENGLIIAQNIHRGLSEVDPANRAFYDTALAQFEATLQRKLIEWKERAKPLQGVPIVTFHASWTYFTAAFGLRVVGFVEPKPGIEPTPSHTAELIELMKREHVSIIGREPYFSSRIPERIASLTKANRLYCLPRLAAILM